MNKNNRLYMRYARSKLPSLEIFTKMVQILADSQREVERLSSLARNMRELTVPIR